MNHRKVLSVLLSASVVLMVSGSAYAQNSLAGASNPPQLVLEFEDNLTDSGGFGHDGTAVGDTTFVDGIVGRAASFDGDGDYIDLANDDGINLTGDWTIMAWVRSNTIDEANTIWAKAFTVNPIDTACCGQDNDENTRGGYLNADGTVQQREPEGGPRTTALINDGNFHHVAFQRDDGAQVEVIDEKTGDISILGATISRIYIDGILDVEDSGLRFPPQRATPGDLKIGHYSSSFPSFDGDLDPQPNPRVPNDFWNGDIDDFRMHPGALTEAQVQSIADGEDLGCPAEGDTVVSTLNVSTPANGLAGVVDVDATAADDGADPVLFTFLASREEAFADDSHEQLLNTTFGPSDAASASMYLTAGTWTIHAFADDDLVCLDAAGSMSSDPFVLGNIAESTGPKILETAGGVALFVEAEHWSNYEDDDGVSELDPADFPESAQQRVIDGTMARGPFVSFHSGSPVMSGRHLRRDGGMDRAFSGFRIDYDMDLDLVGGEAGTYNVHVRCVNTFNTSDFLLASGDPDDGGLGDAFPFVKEGGYNNGNHRIHETNNGPAPDWANGTSAARPCGTADENGLCDRLPGGAGHVKDFVDGVNTLTWIMRQAGPGGGRVRSIFADVIGVTDDPDLHITDTEYFAAEQLNAYNRGDCNSDNNTDLSDGVFGLNFLFLGGDAPTCNDACDSNSDGGNDIADSVFLFNFLFLGGAAPGAPQGCSFAAPVLGCDAPTCTWVAPIDR